MDNWAFADGQGNEITRGWQGTEDQAHALAQKFANKRNDVIEYWPEDAGHDSRTVEPQSRYVIIETMPEHLRESHKAAGNWGRYPANGAVRECMARADAEIAVATDPDGYARIVRDATDADLRSRGLFACVVRWSNGHEESADNYEEAKDLVRAQRPDAAIGHDGDLTEGGERTLCWANAEDAEDDDGARAVASIYEA